MSADLQLHSGHKMVWHASKEICTNKLFIKYCNCSGNHSLTHWPLLWSVSAVNEGKRSILNIMNCGANKLCPWKIDPCWDICCIFGIIASLQEWIQILFVLVVIDQKTTLWGSIPKNSKKFQINSSPVLNSAIARTAIAGIAHKH